MEVVAMIEEPMVRIKLYLLLQYTLKYMVAFISPCTCGTSLARKLL